MGTTKLLTAGGGGVNITPASSIASDVTVNVPSQNCTLGIQGPAFSAYSNAATSLTQNTNTKLAFQVKEYDTASCFDNTTNYRFTPNVAGYYLATGMFQVASTAGGMKLSLYKNGAQYKYMGQAEPSSGFTYGSCYVYLNGSTDYIELYAYQTAATQNTITASSSTWFQAALVRAA